MKGELHISAREATACTYLPNDRRGLTGESALYPRQVLVLFEVCRDLFPVGNLLLHPV
jgi:hypothetical protein